MTALTTVRPALVRALAATVALTAAWGVVSGITQYHFAYACLGVGLVLARCLTKTPTPRTALLPVIAAVLAFTVGFIGDFLAVAVALWLHYDIPVSVIVNHSGEIFSRVAGGHSVTDWIFFLLAAIAAAGLTAGRQLTDAAPFTQPGTQAEPVNRQSAS